MFNASKFAAGATKLVVSAGVGSIIGNAVKFTTPDDLTKLKKISIGVGSFVLGSMVADQATKYTGQQIIELANTIDQIKAEAAAKRAQS